MKLYLDKISPEEFDRLCSLPENEFINGVCFQSDSGNIVAFEFFFDDSTFEHFSVNFNVNG